MLAHEFVMRVLSNPSSNNSSLKQKKGTQFLHRSAALFQLFWIWKIAYFLYCPFYFLALISMRFCMWSQKIFSSPTAACHLA